MHGSILQSIGHMIENADNLRIRSRYKNCLLAVPASQICGMGSIFALQPHPTNRIVPDCLVSRCERKCLGIELGVTYAVHSGARTA